MGIETYHLGRFKASEEELKKNPKLSEDIEAANEALKKRKSDEAQGALRADFIKNEVLENKLSAEELNKVTAEICSAITFFERKGEIEEEDKESIAKNILARYCKLLDDKKAKGHFISLIFEQVKLLIPRKNIEKTNKKFEDISREIHKIDPNIPERRIHDEVV